METEKEKIIITEEDIATMVKQYLEILSSLNETFVGIIYNPETDFFTKASESSISLAIIEIEKDIRAYIEKNGVIPPMVQVEALMKIVSGIHKNILTTTMSELTMTSVLGPYMEDLEKAITDTVAEFGKDEEPEEEKAAE